VYTKSSLIRIRHCCLKYSSTASLAKYSPYSKLKST